MTKQHNTQYTFQTRQQFSPFSFPSEHWRIFWTRERLESMSLPTLCMQWRATGRSRRCWRRGRRGWRATTRPTAATGGAATRATRARRPTMKPARALGNSSARIPSLGAGMAILRQGDHHYQKFTTHEQTFSQRKFSKFMHSHFIMIFISNMYLPNRQIHPCDVLKFCSSFHVFNVFSSAHAASRFRRARM